MDTVEAVVEVQAARGAASELSPGSELVVAAQGGLQGREVSLPSQPRAFFLLHHMFEVGFSVFFGGWYFRYGGEIGLYV